MKQDKMMINAVDLGKDIATQMHIISDGAGMADSESTERVIATLISKYKPVEPQPFTCPDCADITWTPITVWYCPKCGKSTAINSEAHDSEVASKAVKEFAARVIVKLKSQYTYGGIGNELSKGHNGGLRIASEIIRAMAEGKE